MDGSTWRDDDPDHVTALPEGGFAFHDRGFTCLSCPRCVQAFATHGAAQMAYEWSLSGETEQDAHLA